MTSQEFSLKHWMLRLFDALRLAQDRDNVTAGLGPAVDYACPSTVGPGPRITPRQSRSVRPQAKSRASDIMIRRVRP